jgi:hypothetical protein
MDGKTKRENESKKKASNPYDALTGDWHLDLSDSQISLVTFVQFQLGNILGIYNECTDVTDDKKKFHQKGSFNR